MFFFESLLKMPKRMRLQYAQMEMEIGMYWLWCKLRRQKFRYPVFDRKPGVTYLITKQIPGVSITFFGKTFQLIVPVTLEHVEVSSMDGAENCANSEKQN